MKKLILTDCDGVLLDWENAFEEWMAKRGYQKIENYDITAYGLHVHYGIPRKEAQSLVRQFNESAAIGFLRPLRDAQRYIDLMAQKGYKFVVITSLSTDAYATKLREQNLKNVFGNAIEKVVCLDIGADKDEELVKWIGKADYWVEDKWENAVIGASLGFKTFLVKHDHNDEKDHVLHGITKVDGWSEIYGAL